MILYIGLLFFNSLTLHAQAVRINDDRGDAYQWNPAIAMHPNGPTVICWHDSRDGDSKIFMQLLNRRGLPLGGNRRVDDSGEGVNDMAVDVALDKNGQMTITYETQSTHASDIMFRQFYANGTAKGASQKVTNLEPGHFNGFSSLAMSPSGVFVVAWSRDVSKIMAKLFSPNGGDESGEIEVYAPTEGVNTETAVAMHPNDNFMIVWKQRRSLEGRIWGRLFDRAGRPLTDAFEVSDPAVDGNANLASPAIAAGKNGDYFIVWKNMVDQRVWGRRVDANGEFAGAPIPLCENVYTEIQSVAVAAHPQEDRYCYVWIGVQSGVSQLMSNVFKPGGASSLAGQVISSGYVHEIPDVAMGNDANTLYVWEDRRNGNVDIFAQWQGHRTPMRLTAASGFNGMAPISWDPPFAYTLVRPYRIHRINPDGSREVIATVDPADRALPNQMLDYVDHDVENGQTYQYAVQLDGEPEDQLSFVEAQPAPGPAPMASRWLDSPPIIDGDFQMHEWLKAGYMELIPINNPDADRPVYLVMKNDSTHLYICVLDANDHVIDAGNMLGIVFDEDHDGHWESSYSIGEGMLTLTNGAKIFTPFVGDYPNELNFQPPRAAEFVEFVAAVDTDMTVYECAIDLRSSPLNAASGDTIGFGLWIKDPGQFYAWGQTNAGEWPRGALWDAAETFGDLILAQSPKTEQHRLDGRFVIRMETADLFGDGREELVILSINEESEGISPADNGQVEIFQWDGERFASYFSSDILDGRPSTLRVADVDFDGRQDILFTCAGLHMLHNTVDGFELIELISGDFDSFAVLDFTNDGMPDVAVRQIEAETARIAFYRQASALLFESAGALEGWEDLNRMELLNWNGDQFADLICLSCDTRRVLLLHNDGHTLSPAFQDTISSAVFTLAAADFNQDGYDDFAVAGDKIQVFENTHDGRFESAYVGSLSAPAFGLHAASIDEDEHPELIASAVLDLILYDYRNAMDFEQRSDKLISAQSPSIDIASGDLNGNGLIDIIFGSNPIEVLFDAANFYGLATVVESGRENAPVSFQLLQNYPNPFNPTTTIAFDGPQVAKVELKVYDTLGREVATLVDDHYAPGHYTTTFDARRFASGLYFYRLRMGELEQTRKMLLVR